MRKKKHQETIVSKKHLRTCTPCNNGSGDAPGSERNKKKKEEEEEEEVNMERGEKKGKKKNCYFPRILSANLRLIRAHKH